MRSKLNDEEVLKLKKSTALKLTELPFNINEIPNIVLAAWDDIFTISDATEHFKIGLTAFPKPQIMGFMLEILVAQKFVEKDKSEWAFDPTGYSKDITNLKGDELSIEIKTSSSKKSIFGNRSYANPGSTSKKSKNSFYLAINFEKFNELNSNTKPSVKLIRIGYLEHEDWIGQASQSGQQARLKKEAQAGKLLEIWPKKDPELK